jgi:hypothetical protein
MSPLNQGIFVAGLFVSGLCLAFLYRTFVELRRIDERAERFSETRDPGTPTIGKERR